MPMERQLSLLCRVGDVLCALPLEHVEEIMRPLAVDPIPGVPAFVQGVALVRGTPTPIVDAATLLGGAPARATRFVTLKTGPRRTVLAVEAVVGVVEIPSGSVGSLPPLFTEAGSDSIAAIGALDTELLLVVRSARLIPDAIWAAMQAPSGQ
jgi:purine-binding chemotaxis protein CheW